jgi:hypothetical protein
MADHVTVTYSTAMSNSGSERYITSQGTYISREVIDRVMAALMSGDKDQRMAAVVELTNEVPRIWQVGGEM